MNTFDLQIQSSASDGKYTPRELVRRAAGLGLKTIALTDHDTVSGVPEALSAGEDYGIDVIPGIEISAHDETGDMHILGFGIDHKSTALLQVLEEAQKERVGRAKEIVRRLQKIGFQVTYEDVLRHATGLSIGRPHIAQAILANPENKKLLGRIEDVGGFIKAYLVPGQEAYVSHENISVQSAISVIHHARGVAIWSHPALHFADFDELERALKKFVDFGIDGVEVLNPSHTEIQVRFLNKLAAKYSLLVSAGSDFHTDESTHLDRGGGPELASFIAYGINLSNIVLKLKEAVARKRQEM